MPSALLETGASVAPARTTRARKCYYCSPLIHGGARMIHPNYNIVSDEINRLYLGEREA